MAKVQYYEVRVRERVAPNKWVKKSKFFEAKSPREAVSMYKGNGHIMWAQKVSRERLLGIGEFFTMGDDLLREFRQGGDSLGFEDVRKNRRNNKGGG